MPFGQLVIGPPGSGKTTYCQAVFQFLNALKRDTVVVNLDPANDKVPYIPHIDIRDLITVEEAMQEHELGPNGALVYCLEFIALNYEWLVERLMEIPEDTYLVFDCPGQVELYTHDDSTKNLLARLHKDYRLCAVHLIDAHYCAEPSKYIAALLLSLKAMIHLELPHVNILSKLDLIQQFGELRFNLDFYADVQDLRHLMHELEETTPWFARYKRFNEAICQLIEDYGLVSFLPLSVKDPKLIGNAMNAIDRANGYGFQALSLGNEGLFETAAKVGAGYGELDIKDIQEEYVDLLEHQSKPNSGATEVDRDQATGLEAWFEKSVVERMPES